MIKEINLGGVTFSLDGRQGNLRGKSEGNKFVLVKDERFLDFYKQLKIEKKPKTIMEVGMFEGGSMVYMDKLFEPDVLVGLDIRREPIHALEEYKKDKPHIKTYYARSQDKPGTLMAARSNFPTGIDLVIDDASHLYEQSKATFEQLFPLVKSGGTYILEDWAWSHTLPNQQNTAPWYDKNALTNLVFEFVVAVCAVPNVESLHINRNLVAITKGSGPVKEGFMDLSNSLRGKKLPLI